MRKAKLQPLKALVNISTDANKTIWRRIGTAFPLKNRPGFSLRLEMIPAPIDGAYDMILVEPNPETAAAGE